MMKRYQGRGVWIRKIREEIIATIIYIHRKSLYFLLRKLKKGMRTVSSTKRTTSQLKSIPPVRSKF
jgi:hypothetical protein